MSSWAALNARPSSDARDQSAALEQATDEAQDAEHTAMYEQALRCQQRHEHAAAKTLYLALLHSAFRTPTRLVYLCYKNLVSLDFEVQSFEDALLSYSQAVSLDATDVVVWYQMATSAVETGKLWLARRALEEGFKVDATYWPLVETLALVLHVLKDEGAYECVAQYLRERDPQCALVQVIDAMRRSDAALETELEMERLRGDKLVLRRAQKRLRHVETIVERGTKRRRELERERADKRRKQVRRRRTYTLLQASWTRLGELLLEAFDEIHRDVEAHVLQTEVEIRVGFCDEEIEDCAAEEAEKEVDRDGDLPLSNGVQLKEPVEVTAAAGCDTPMLTEISDNDTQDSGKYASEVMVDQPKRRKSRRRENQLWQEQAAAMKKAREQALAYRLQAFLPTNVGDEEKNATQESVLSKWLPSLTVENVNGKFCILNARKEVFTELASFAISTEEPASDSDISCSRMCSREQAAHEVALQPEMVTARQIVSFVTGSAGGTTRSGVIIDWMRRYLNQCSQWSLLHPDDDDGKIHKVCAWLEKAINGDLDILKLETRTQPTVINVADHSLIQNSRFERNGLSPNTRLFLLELRFDTLLPRSLRGRKMCGMEKLLEVQLAEAETLMFEFGWLENAENVICDPNGSELLRLLRLIAQMHERCRNPRMAQHYFAKYRERE
uniref:Uncharacterized protein n=1 Tax=Peronospora matthiolae TaxID=2874970 RepID=A0AAV1VHU8_9STRA